MYKLIAIQKPTFRAPYGKEELVGQLLSTLHFFKRLPRGRPTRVSWIVCKKSEKCPTRADSCDRLDANFGIAGWRSETPD